MHASTARRVARSYLGSTTRTAVIAHVDPIGNSWGWFADDTPRMHLVPMDPEHRGTARIWLEDRGVRCFKVDHAQPSAGLDIDELRESVHRTRDTIESAWLQSAERKGWLAYCAGDATIGMYFGTLYQFVRRLRDSPPSPELIQPDVSTNAIWLEVKANRVIWQGADDGSDA